MIPTTWTALLDRLAYQLGGRSGSYPLEAEEWIRTAVEARFDVSSLHDLDRARRQIAFQKSAGVVLGLESGLAAESEVALEPDCRARIAALFARYFDGVAVEGPPWRISPTETTRPSWEDWNAEADFPVAHGGDTR